MSDSIEDCAGESVETTKTEVKCEPPTTTTTDPEPTEAAAVETEKPPEEPSAAPEEEIKQEESMDVDVCAFVWFVESFYLIFFFGFYFRLLSRVNKRPVKPKKRLLRIPMPIPLLLHKNNPSKRNYHLL